MPLYTALPLRQKQDCSADAAYGVECRHALRGDWAEQVRILLEPGLVVICKGPLMPELVQTPFSRFEV